MRNIVFDYQAFEQFNLIFKGLTTTLSLSFVGLRFANPTYGKIRVLGVLLVKLIPKGRASSQALPLLQTDKTGF